MLYRVGFVFLSGFSSSSQLRRRQLLPNPTLALLEALLEGSF
jgi:hypothetical protein